MPMIKHPSYVYAQDVVSGKIPAPKYVIIQCHKFKEIFDGNHPKYKINHKRIENIDKILKVLKMAKGIKVGKTIYESLSGYQWLLIIASLCTVHSENPKMRRYRTAILEICRKNGKTFIVALLFILLFYLEPPFSQFFSVAPDGALARLIKEAMDPILKTNAEIFENGEFKILRDYILHNPTHNKYTPLNYSTSRLDGREPNVFIADEVGALPNNYAIEAMRSGQLTVLNKLGFIISTKYPTINNPLEDEVANAKKILDGVREDDTVFALLYEPDDTEHWTNNDMILKQTNPLALDIPEIWDDLISKRSDAINRETLRENFLTKHCNIIYQGLGTESFVDIKDLQKCRVNKIDWTGREVYLGVDLSMTNDNTAVAMAAVDDNDNILVDVFCFIPEGRIEEKSKFERLNYQRFVRTPKCIACGNKTIDYGVVERFVSTVEKNFGVTIKAIGYDRYNALSSAQKWEQKYNTIEIRQHSDTLHPPTKLLTEKIANGEFKYEKNTLLEINFENARCTYDTNMNRYVTKKKSNGKVDMVVATINAIYLLQQDILFNSNSFVVQT